MCMCACVQIFHEREKCSMDLLSMQEERDRSIITTRNMYEDKIKEERYLLNYSSFQGISKSSSVFSFQNVSIANATLC